MSKKWTGKIGIAEDDELSVDAMAVMQGDVLNIVYETEDIFSAIPFTRKNALSLATWILDNVEEPEE